MSIISNNKTLIRHQVGHGITNGTFGELLQGMLPNKRNFMVTFPINLFSYVTFIPQITTNRVLVFPEHKVKSLHLAKNLIKSFNIEVGGKLIVNSQLPEGKGLASSSADLVATAYAVSNAFKINITEKLIARLIRPIEPSDGVMYPGIVSFYYKELQLIESIGNSIPNLVVIAIDEGGIIDTVRYNCVAKFYSELELISYKSMLSCISTAIKSRDLSTIGKISTESSIMNQKYNPKKYLEAFIQICKDIGGLGVSVAHSGTFLGILLDSNSIDFEFQKEACLERIKTLNNNSTIFYSLSSNIDKPNYNFYLDEYPKEKIC